MEEQQVYKSLFVMWENKYSSSRLELYNKTIHEAYEKAVFFGFEPSPWWNFWDKNKVTITWEDRYKHRWSGLCAYVFYSADKYVKVWW